MGGGDYANFYGPQINSVGEVAFGAIITPTTPGPRYLQSTNRTAPRSPKSRGATTQAASCSPLINDAGDVAFVGSDVPRIFLHSQGSTEVIAQEGQSISDGTAIIQTETFPHMLLNDQGQVAFGARVFVTAENQSQQGLYIHDGTEVVEVALEGQSLAGSVITSLFLYDGPTPPLISMTKCRLSIGQRSANGREVIARFEPQMYWRNAGSGSWGADANWSLNFAPRKPYDVFIVAESELTVTGPAVNRTVKSLSIGGDDTAIATLDLTSGTTLTATNGTTIRANGVLSGEGTLAGDVANLGGIVSPGSSPGVLNIDGDFTVDQGGMLEIEVAGLAAGQFDLLEVLGDVNLADAVLKFIFVDGFLPQQDDSFVFLGIGADFDATNVRAQFEGVATGFEFAVLRVPDGLAFQALNDAQPVPEPSTLSLLLVALAALVLRQPQTSRF